MASRFDLAPRLDALQAQGLEVQSSYQSTPAQWLAHALDSCDAHVINAKGCKLDDTPVLVRLSKLEALVAAATKEIA